MTRDQRRELYDAVFNNPMGAKVLKDIAKGCQIDYTSFSADPLQMAYKEGQKESYRRIQKQLEAK